jgi:GNAT superfamily N-acetyltransferase
LYDIIIKGYELTEEEVWGKNYVRIYRPAYDQLVQKAEILLVRYANQIVGGIHHYKVNEDTYTFSLLATDFSAAGKGIGSSLIKHVEKIAKQEAVQKIQIEILRVRGLNTESKLRLDAFYKRLGYAYTHSEDCICKIPIEKYKKLKAESDFDFYVKHI